MGFDGESLALTELGLEFLGVQMGLLFSPAGSTGNDLSSTQGEDGELCAPTA